MLSDNEYRSFWNGVIFLVAFVALSFLTFVVIINQIGLQR